MLTHPLRIAVLRSYSVGRLWSPTAAAADPSMLQLIDTMSDAKRKSEATLSCDCRPARFDAAGAEALLDELNPGDAERDQFEQVLQSYDGRGIYD